jgi:glutamyl-tRNA synthetase
LGVGENDVAVSVKNLYAENRKLVDPVANRYFFVWDPVEIKIESVEEREVKIPLHPTKGGFRVLNGKSRVYITVDDFENLREGDVIRLKDFCNIRLVDKDERIFEFVSYELGEIKKGRIIHWLSKDDSIDCKVIGEVSKEGFAEKNALNDIGKVVQFERFAFCRLEALNGILRAVYTHP